MKDDKRLSTIKDVCAIEKCRNCFMGLLIQHENHAKEMLVMWESKRAETGKYEKFRQKEIGYWCGRLEAIQVLKEVKK